MSRYTKWNWERCLFTAFLIVGGLAIVGFFVTAYRMEMRAAHHMNAGGGVTQIALQRTFERYNDTYFNGSLPVDTQVLYREPPDPGNIGETFCDVMDDNTTQHCRMYITPFYNNAMPTAVETLIHESCHIATMGKDFDHGPVWQKCMLDVANAGGFEGVW